MISLDDKYLPNEAATNAKRLVQQYHVPGRQLSPYDCVKTGWIRKQ
ncbi:MAG: hypothetical protein IRY98_12805 [Alicyclobacillaceae bacterium]|nr:hypothetical protein [Alicyclobacillaceae bacterium]